MSDSLRRSLNNNIKPRIEYMLETMSHDDVAEELSGVISAKDNHIKKLADICSAQETEIEQLKKRISELGN